MPAFMLKELFSIFGLKISGKVLLYLFLGIALILGCWLGYKKIREPYDQLATAQKQIASLSKDKQTLTQQKSELEQINSSNAQSYQVQIDQLKASQAIAQNEATATKTRDTKSKEVRDAINSSPADGKPVSPVIIDTANRLWNTTAGNSQ
jgi:uncharacterized membrane-anchored protein YhcB (DUF1043 family)